MRDAARPFFSRLTDHPQVLKEYEAAYEDYCDKLRAGAVEKKKEDAEQQARAGAGDEDGPKSLEEVPREERLGPGGLDPVEVFDSLPLPMQEVRLVFPPPPFPSLRSQTRTRTSISFLLLPLFI